MLPMSLNTPAQSLIILANSRHVHGTGHSGLGQGHDNDTRGGSVFAGTLVSVGCGIDGVLCHGTFTGPHEAPGTRCTCHMILG